MYKFMVNGSVNVFLSEDTVRKAESVAVEFDKLNTRYQEENACFSSALREYFHAEDTCISMGDLNWFEGDAMEAWARLEEFRYSHRRDVETLEFIRRFGG